jgi:ribulose-phosphate 3-epimerase
VSIIISPSILSADLTRLGEDVQSAADGGADWLHIDVMDGRFVPWLTIGPPVVKALKGITDLPLDVHLMTVQPEQLIPEFIRAGADIITVHAEACAHLHNTIHQIKAAGLKAGVALNPATPLCNIEHVLPDVDLALILAVDPGFAGMSPFAGGIEKTAQLCKMLTQPQLDHVIVQIDGGIKADNIGAYVQAGATSFVAGSAVFNDKASVAANIAALRHNAKS